MAVLRNNAAVLPTLEKQSFFFLRHGETDWNREERAQGQVDIPLNARGLMQAEDAALAFEGIEIGSIVSSPLSRAYVTAEAVARVTGAPLYRLDGLMECSWGEWEGKIKEAWYSGWKTGELTPKGGESYPDFQARAIAGFNEALTYQRPVLVVGHGGLFGTLRGPCGLDPSYAVPNATPLRMIPPAGDGDAWQFETLSLKSSPGAEPEKMVALW